MTESEQFQKTHIGMTCPKCLKEFPSDITKCPDDGLDLVSSNEDLLVGKTFAEHYEVSELIGQGGMSRVYKARHILMENKVAIKVLLSHLISKQTTLQRFRQEAKAVSVLRHHNIMTVHDFGISKDNQAYMIMDYLEGLSLSDLLDKHAVVEVDRAVNIFLQIASALDHAHRKSIIHRDLKPSNIMLVEEEDQEDVVKIVDFGIAKLLPGGEAEGAKLTQTGEVFGSPLYMSPEQCMGQELDNRSDIFSTGCLMYETLTGVPPFGGDNMLEIMYNRLTETPESFKEANSDLNIPEKLEQIVMVTLAREPADRYQSMAELRDDLARFQEGSSLVRTPAKAEKQVLVPKGVVQASRTRRVIISSVVAVLVLLTGFFAWRTVSVSQQVELFTISPQEKAWEEAYQSGQRSFDEGNYDEAIARFAAAAKAAEPFGESDRRLVTSLEKLAVSYRKSGDDTQAQYLEDEIKDLKKRIDVEDPEAALGKLVELTLGLEDGDKTAAKPEEKIDQMNKLASHFFQKKEYDRAEQLFKKAIKLGEKELGPDSARVATSLNSLGVVFQYARGNYPEAERSYNRALEIRAKALGEGAPEVAETLTNLARLDQSEGKYDEADEKYHRALKIQEQTLGVEHPQVADTLNALAGLERVRGKYRNAEELYRHAMDIYEEIEGPRGRQVGQVSNNLAGLFFNEGKYAEAEPLYRKALIIYESTLGPDDPSVAHILANLGAVYAVEGKYSEAEPILKRSLAIRKRILSLDSPEVAQSMNSLAEVYREKGRYAEAKDLYDQALVIAEKSLGPDHVDVANIKNGIGKLYLDQGDPTEAQKQFQEALEIREKSLGPEHPAVAESLNGLALTSLASGDYKKAEELFVRALNIKENALGTKHPSVAETLEGYSKLLWKTNRFGDAINRKLQALSIRSG